MLSVTVPISEHARRGDDVPSADMNVATAVMTRILEWSAYRHAVLLRRHRTYVNVPAVAEHEAMQHELIRAVALADE
jgi:hypothetical protein